MMSLLQRRSPARAAGKPTPLFHAAPSPDVYRHIYVSLEVPRDSHPVIGVTSAIAGEGRTSIALGLARTLAADLVAPVLLVEVDLERPSLAEQFNLSAAAGLCDVLRSEDSHERIRIEDVMRPVSDNLFVVTAGTLADDAARLLRTLPLHDPFHSFGWQPAATILDLPPIINHSYAPLAASVADMIVMVVRAGVTPAPVVREAIARLEDQPPRGVVLNGVSSALPPWWPDSGS